jgi:hypothetical protein
VITLQLAADGRRILDARTGGVIGMTDEPAQAEQIAQAVNGAETLAADLEDLLVAAGLDYARSWAPREALQEVTRQVRMVRRTSAGAQLARIEAAGTR